MKLLAFAASSSKTSINKQLVRYAASLVPDADVEVLDLNDYELPLYSADEEAELGQPDLAKAFVDKIKMSDALVISFAEHNGAYTAAYKNTFDWATRVEKKVFQGKPMVLLATSPGARGAASVLALAEQSVPHFDGKVVGTLSVPSFGENFDVARQQLVDETLTQKLTVLMRQLMGKQNSHGKS